MVSMVDRLKLMAFAIGIFVSYSIMAVFQEKIFKEDYNGERFVYPAAFVAVQSLVYFISAKGFMMTHDHPVNATPQIYYILVALCYLIAMTSSNMAIQYIPYVVQVVGKACKPIPVMLCAVLIVRKTYTIQKYIFVLMIVSGVGIFIYKERINKTEDTFWGYILILVSLIFDGFLGAAQDKMRTVAKPSSLNFMYYVNAWSTLMFIPVLFINYEGLRFLEFCYRHSSVTWYMLITVTLGTAGQYFVSAMISHFGSLPLALATTMRKFFTVLFSSFLFGNVLNLRQWIATVIIFVALTLDAFFSKKGSNANRVEPQILEESKIKNISCDVPCYNV